MVNSPKVSIIIPVYNGGKYLAEAIQSAIDQTYRPIEVLVVDDASMDRSAEIAASFGPPVRVLRNERNMERSWSRNRAVRESSGELIAFLDADDLWLQDKLEKQVALLIQQPACALAYAKTQVFVTENGNKVYKQISGGSYQGDRCDRYLVRCNFLPMLTVMVRRTCFDAVGGFDCTPWVQGCEDYDLWLRLANRFPIAFLDSVVALYRSHAEQTTTNNRRIEITSARVRWRFIKNHAEALIGKTRAEIWLDRYQHLARFADRATRRGDYADAINSFMVLIKDRPWHLRWSLSLYTAILKYLRVVCRKLIMHS